MNINLDITKEQKSEMESQAEARSLSVNDFLNDLIVEEIQAMKDLDAWMTMQAESQA